MDGSDDDEVWAFVRGVLSVNELPSTPPLGLDALPLPDVALSDDLLGGLVAIVGEPNVHTDRYERAFHAVGKSYFDLLRIRNGEIAGAPDAVTVVDAVAPAARI